jgi:SPP1 family predicted phage head-tail adaptor
MRLETTSKYYKMRELARVRRRKIIIQKRIVGTDEWGNDVDAWMDWRTLWAEMESLWGQDYYAARALGEQNTIIFVLQYVPFLDQLNTKDFRVLYDPVSVYDQDPTTDTVTMLTPGFPAAAIQDRKCLRIYNIKTIDPYKDGGSFIKLRCLEEDRTNG